MWAIRGALEAPEDPDVETEVVDLRRAGQIFDDVSAQLVATATALLNWHDERPVQRRGRRTDEVRSELAGRGSTRSPATRSSRASTRR